MEKSPHPIAESRSSKSTFDTALEAAEIIFNNLTFKVFASIIVLGIGLALVAFLYDNRSWLFNSAISNARQSNVTWTLGEESRHQAYAFMQTAPIVQFVGIAAVNLRQNRRQPVFFMFKDPHKQQLVNHKVKNLLLAQSVFDFNHTNTKHMVKVIANEFVCIPFKEGYYSQYAPEFERDIPVLCYLSIPPYTGHFFGFINIGLSKMPAPNELEALRIELTRLSLDIFLRDILKKGEKDWKGTTSSK
jgi:hypothetical protein